MTELEITQQLTKMKTEARYTTVKGVDTEFYVVSFSMAKGTLKIKTTISEHTIPTKNYYEFVKLWRKEPLVEAKPETGKAKPARLEAVQDTTITGAASKYVHVTSPVKVYVTTNYKMFKHTLGNRMLNKNKIKKIVSDIKNNLDRLSDFPILVDPANMQIKDGQHRLESAMTAQVPIYYIFARPMQLHEIARVNSNTERWKATDFINCYVEQGNEEYKILRDFIKEYGFPLSVTMGLLIGRKTPEGGGGQQLQEKFERGQFVVSRPALEEAKELAKLIARFSKFSAHTSRNFINAIEAIRSKGLCDFDILVKKFEQKPDMLKPHQDKKAFIANLELVYNLNAHKRTIIF